MKIIRNEDGSKAYQFDEKDEKLKELFELSGCQGIAVETMIQAMLEASGKLSLESKKIWKQIAIKIKEVDSDFNDENLKYNPITEKFTLH